MRGKIMKKMSLIYFSLIILVISNIIFLMQLNQKQSAIDHCKSNILFDNLLEISSVLSESSNILDQYSENFTEKEKKLFQTALGRVRGNLSHIGVNINGLYFEGVDWHKEIYQDRVFEIEKIVKQIETDEIHNEEDVQAISIILDQHGKELGDLFYIEQIGLSGIYKKDGQERIMIILENAKNSVDVVVEDIEN